MNAQTLISELSFHQLANLAMSKDGSGTIRTQDMGKVIACINDGLRTLHEEFTILQKVVHIRLYEHITTYHLLSRFADSQQPQPDVAYPYIIDHNRSPFKGDVNKVTAIWDNQGRQRVINDENSLRSVFVMGPDSITVPYPEKDVILFVHYNAKPQLVSMESLDEELDIPSNLVPALKAFVASQIFLSIGSNDSARMAQVYENQYVSMVRMLKASDALAESKFTTNQFEERGWV